MTASITRNEIADDLRALGLSRGDLVLCHSSLSSIGRVAGGATAVVGALLDVIGSHGTLLTPAFTNGLEVPFTSDTRSPLGAIPNAVLDHPDRHRSSHPEVSVAAIGAAATVLCARQPLAYGLGADSPFHEFVRRDGKILLIGVGHDRSSMLHHAESLVPQRRTKVRRFPISENGASGYAEVPDVGNDNATFFPTVGAEFEAFHPSVRIRSIGAAPSRLFDAAPYDEFAQRRLAELLTDHIP